MSNQGMDIGERLKSLRLRNGLSIEDLAKKTGLPESVISEIESHTISPPLGNIIILANAFKVTVGEVFGDSADSPFCIVRKDDQKPVSRFGSTNGKSSSYSYKSLGHQKANRQMEPFLVTLNPAGNPNYEPNQHVGEEILYVLEGQVKVKLADHTDVLNPGDSIYYDSNLPHAVSCHGGSPATILAVIYTRKEVEIF